MNTQTINSTTQAAAVLITSIFFYMILTISVGPVVDIFVYEIAGVLPLSATAQGWMNDIILFGSWWFHLIKLMIVIMIVWFFIFILKRWRYNRQVDEFDWYERM